MSAGPPPPNNPAGNSHQEADAFVDAVTAAMPPGMQRAQQTSTDELLREMNRVPLFMTSLDEGDGAGGENSLLEAIKALAYEGTRAEVAANFREQGNEAARAKLWRDAREFYTKAIHALQGQIETTPAPEGVGEGGGEALGVAPGGPRVVELDEEAEARKERELEEACLVNRALCNLETKNYGSCNRDCAAALRMNPRNVKAWYRAGSACLGLDKVDEALDACESGLRFDASNASLKTLLAKAEKRRDYLAQLKRDREAREERTRQEKTALKQALRTRNIVTRDTDSPPDMEDAAISLTDAKDPTSALSFPVIFLYPLHAQTDFIKAIREDEALAQHLDYILPVPWDEKAEYGATSVECYMETIQGGLIKAGKKLPLLQLLGSGKVEIVDGLVRVYVVPKARASEWIDQFKLRRGKS